MSVVVIHGASKGIGFALMKQILYNSNYSVVATARSEKTFLENVLKSHLSAKEASERVHFIPMDVTKEDSIESASKAFHSKYGLKSVAAVMNFAGYLNPEKTIRQANQSEIWSHFAVNTVGPMLIAKHWHQFMVNGNLPGKPSSDSLLPPFKQPLWINMSARTGSIGDNRLGGWYSYRMSKAGLNQLTRCLSVELGRKGICVASLHPGTVDSDLSRKFISRSSSHTIYTTDQSAENLFRVMKTLELEKHNGSFLDYKGQVIEW